MISEYVQQHVTADNSNNVAHFQSSDRTDLKLTMRINANANGNVQQVGSEVLVGKYLESGLLQHTIFLTRTEAYQDLGEGGGLTSKTDSWLNVPAENSPLINFSWPENPDYFNMDGCSLEGWLEPVPSNEN